jgi:hypothetical protein
VAEIYLEELVINSFKLDLEDLFFTQTLARTLYLSQFLLHRACGVGSFWLIFLMSALVEIAETD